MRQAHPLTDTWCEADGMSALGQKPTLVTAPFCVCSTPESGRSQPALFMSAKCQKQTFGPIEAVPDIRIRLKRARNLSQVIVVGWSTIEHLP